MEDTEEPFFAGSDDDLVFLRMRMRIEAVTQKNLGTMDELYEYQPQRCKPAHSYSTVVISFPMVSSRTVTTMK